MYLDRAWSLLFVVPDFKFGLFGMGGAFNDESSAMRSINDCVPGSTSLCVRWVFAVIAFLLSPTLDCWLRNCLSGSWMGSSPINSWQRATAAASFASAVVLVRFGRAPGLGSQLPVVGCRLGGVGRLPAAARVRRQPWLASRSPVLHPGSHALGCWAAVQSTGRFLVSYRPLARLFA